MDGRWEWVEIIEPRTRERMYANLTTGECVWEAPSGVSVKKTHENQWWELYDQNTGRYYYYNATSQKTVWHKPSSCDIIPLAKLQTLKLSTEQMDSRTKPVSSGTQTPERRPRREQNSTGHVRNTQPSPSTRRRQYGHHYHHNFHQPTTGAFDKVDQFINGNASNLSSSIDEKRSAGSRQGPPADLRMNTAQPFHRVPESPGATRANQFNREVPNRLSGHGKDWTEQIRPRRSTSDHGQPDRHASKGPAALQRSGSFDHGHSTDQRMLNYHLLQGGSLRGPPRHYETYSIQPAAKELDLDPSQLSSSVPSSTTIPNRIKLGTRALPRTNPTYKSPRSAFTRVPSADGVTQLKKTTGDIPRRASDSSSREYLRDAYLSQGSINEAASRSSLRSLPEGARVDSSNQSSPSSPLDQASAFTSASMQDSLTTHKESPCSTSSSKEFSNDSLEETPAAWNEAIYQNKTPTVYENSSVIYNKAFGSRHNSNSKVQSEQDSSDSSSSNEKLVFVEPSAHVSSEANKLVVSRVESSSSLSNFLTSKPMNEVVQSPAVSRQTSTEVAEPTELLVQPIMSRTSPQKAIVRQNSREGSSGRENSQPKSADNTQPGELYASKSQTRLHHSISEQDELIRQNQIDIPAITKPAGLRSVAVVPSHSRSSSSSSNLADISKRDFHSSIADLTFYEQKASSRSPSLASLSNIVAPCGSTEDLDNVDHVADQDVFEKTIEANMEAVDTTVVVDNEENGSNSDLVREITSSLDEVLQSMDNAMSGKIDAQSKNTTSKTDIEPAKPLKQEEPDTPIIFKLPTELDSETILSRPSSEMSEPDYVSLPLNLTVDNRVVMNPSRSLESSSSEIIMRSHIRTANTNNHSPGSGQSSHHPSISSMDTPRSLPETLPKPPTITPEGTTNNSTPVPLLHRSYSEMKPNRPVSMLFDDSPPSIQRSLHRQYTFSETSKATSLSRGVDMKKVQSEALFGWYAENCINKPKKGLFGRKSTPEMMLSWTAEAISRPMLRIEDKILKKEALETFKLIQMYMGDRKAKQLSHLTALSVSTKGWSNRHLRDEIYVQLIKQTTENHNEESLSRGWELLAICLAFFPPSQKFQSYLSMHIMKPLMDEDIETESVIKLIGQVVPISYYAHICKRRLDRICTAGARKGLRKPTREEIEQAIRSIYHPSMFGDNLEEIIAMQKAKFPDRQLPWILTTLSEEILKLSGAQTEGIFRVPADQDEMNALKVKFDHWELPQDLSDVHLPASLLKLWCRELYVPIIPPDVYEQCMVHFENPVQAIAIVQSLPEINRLVLSYLIRLLQVFAAPENVVKTKMDMNNLAMVMAPNCLRCESDDPRIIFENTRKEMQFIRTLIQHLDTSFMEGVC